ncbi:hypothetical protein Fleli_3726 [Bernardetia litoralis DSM 6794]|uniref:UPF0316 protein Fleli_3726 n=1 Tax=Bernardetia litoralis (strain ATCC 23117 / DSM 6794 / NBRC 15988 / NCIMB 1366 / Fx l1 / Sio-4) TaxID=880071 RepID=I4AQ03_BERLS|nr:DUF2179 domain-containing protein [Bernardetia litoralis]AFM06038.1 hypothetical protein Fleli_3726 [Bernardetia litoralis DSM 6794]
MQDFFYTYLNEDTLWVYSYIILPILIFLARLTDVSLSTLRIVLVTMGKRNIAPLIGFIEAFVWLLAIGQIMQNLTNIMSYLAYAGGFAMGTYLGIWLEQKIALGIVMVRIITGKTADSLIYKLKDTNYRFTHLKAEGKYGDVGVVFSIVKRKELPKFLHLINTHNPNAFYTIENIRHVQNTDDIPTSDSGTFSRVVRKIKTIRK